MKKILGAVIAALLTSAGRPACAQLALKPNTPNVLDT